MMSGVQPEFEEPSQSPQDGASGASAGLAQRILEQIRPVVVGQDETVELMLIALACRGHVLLQGVPGAALRPHGNAHAALR